MRKSKDAARKVIKISTLYSTLCVICIIVHVALTIVFACVKMIPLTILNSISVLIYILLHYLIRNKQFEFSTIICCIEIAFNAFASSVMLSWQFGFYFYFFALVPLSFYCKFKNKNTKFYMTAWIMVAFLITYFISHSTTTFFEMGKAAEIIIYLINAICCFAVLVFLSYIYTKTIIYETKLLSESNITLQKLASTDSLTGLLNRRSMMEKLTIAEEKKQTISFVYSLVMIDIDDFKKVNDTYGHDCGDFVLQKLCERIRSNLRKDDIICRWGGEEILILLPNTYTIEAEVVAQKLKVAVETDNFIFNEKNVRVTITLGISCSLECEDITQMISQADLCLYKGKTTGKNKVVSSLK